MAFSIYFVSLITRDNRPLYTQSFFPNELSNNGDDPEQTTKSNEPSDQFKANEWLKFNCLSHMALDVFLSPFFDSTSPNSLMFIQDGLAVYGYEGNTGVKIIIGTSTSTDGNPELSILFKQIHMAYIRLICNPFQQLDENSLISSKSFETSIKNVIDEWNRNKNLKNYLLVNCNSRSIHVVFG